MTTNAAQTQKVESLPIAFNEIRLKGKIQSFENVNGVWYTIIHSPSNDEWTSPSRFKLKSNYQLGNLEELKDFRCKVSGSVRRKNYTDRQTGQPKTFDEATVYFEVVS